MARKLRVGGMAKPGRHRGGCDLSDMYVYVYIYIYIYSINIFIYIYIFIILFDC